jgi:hypothetical protein
VRLMGIRKWWTTPLDKEEWDRLLAEGPGLWKRRGAKDDRVETHTSRNDFHTSLSACIFFPSSYIHHFSVFYHSLALLQNSRN